MCLLSIYLHRDQCRLHCSASTSSSFEYQWGLWSFCEQKHNNLWWMLERVCFVYTACVHTWKCPWFNSVSVRASVQQMLDRWALNLIHITHICHFLFEYTVHMQMHGAHRELAINPSALQKTRMCCISASVVLQMKGFFYCHGRCDGGLMFQPTGSQLITFYITLCNFISEARTSTHWLWLFNCDSSCKNKLFNRIKLAFIIFFISS